MRDKSLSIYIYGWRQTSWMFTQNGIEWESSVSSNPADYPSIALPNKR